MVLKKTTAFIFLAFVLLAFTQCGNGSGKTKLIIFHAGSLAVPFQEIAKEFEKENPDIEIQLEAAGSIECARKITDLKRDCDIMASADYTVIEQFLIPKYAGWNIHFAQNEMVIAYTEKSKHANEITKYNWFEVLQNEEVHFGRSNPDKDPCGYRTLFTWQLAEKYYGKGKFYETLSAKDNEYIRPKETDLLALLEAGAIDYIFIYRSVAKQHGLKILLLPAEINLKATEYAQFYEHAEVEVQGNKPGEYKYMTGKPMAYSFCILNKAPHKKQALLFSAFLLNRNKGLKIMEENGQKTKVFVKEKYAKQLPERLRKLLN